MSDNCNEALAVEIKNFKEFIVRMEHSFDRKFDDFKQDNKDAHAQIVKSMLENFEKIKKEDDLFRERLTKNIEEVQALAEQDHINNAKRIGSESKRIETLEKSKMWLKGVMWAVGSCSFLGFGYIGYTLNLIEKNYSYEIKGIVQEETKTDKEDIKRLSEELKNLTTKLKELEVIK